MAEAVGKLLEYLPPGRQTYLRLLLSGERAVQTRLIEKYGFVLEGRDDDSKSLDRTFPSYEYVYEARIKKPLNLVFARLPS